MRLARNIAAVVFFLALVSAADAPVFGNVNACQEATTTTFGFGQYHEFPNDAYNDCWGSIVWYYGDEWCHQQGGEHCYLSSYNDGTDSSSKRPVSSVVLATRSPQDRRARATPRWLRAPPWPCGPAR